MTDGTVLLPFRAPRHAAHPVFGGRRPVRRGDARRRARDVVVSAPVRARRSAFLRWALANGRRIDGDAASVIVAELHRHGTRRIRLTDDLLTELVWIDAVQWCDDHGVVRPDGFADTMHAMVDFAATSGWSHRDSDPVDELHAVIQAIGAPSGGDRHRSSVPTA